MPKTIRFDVGTSENTLRGGACLGPDRAVTSRTGRLRLCSRLAGRVVAVGVLALELAPSPFDEVSRRLGPRRGL
jgi:hypothetical protein